MSFRVMLQACKRCGGDLMRDQDGDLCCLQCGGTFMSAQERRLIAVLAETEQVDEERRRSMGSRGPRHAEVRL